MKNWEMPIVEELDITKTACCFPNECPCCCNRNCCRTYQDYLKTLEGNHDETDFAS